MRSGVAIISTSAGSDSAVRGVSRTVRPHRQTRDERKVITANDPTMRAFAEQLQTLKQEITRLDEVIRENGGVINDG